MTLIRSAACAAFTAGLALVVACTSPQAAPAGHPAHGHEIQSAAEPRHGQVGGEHGPAGVALAIEPQTPRAGERAELVFTLTGAAGEPIEELSVSHGRKLHVVIVSDDMAALGHVHPEDFGGTVKGGEARINFTFPHGGRYLVALDFVSQEGPKTAKFIVEVAGPAQAVAVATPSVAVVEMEGDDLFTGAIVLGGAGGARGYGASLAKPQRIAAGEPATFSYRFSADGAPLTDLRPYLDAPMHLAVVKDDLSAFLHAHGSAAMEESHDRHDAHGHGSGGDGHAHGGVAAFGPEVTATLTFPEPGRYVLFGQAAHGDRLLVSRFPVEVR